MTLSLSDAAAALGKTQRQLRYMIRKKRLRATKVGGRWRIDSDDLPLSDGQRRALGARADTVRQALDEALTPVADAQGKAAKRRYSVRDLHTWKVGEPVFRAVADALGPGDRAVALLRESLDLLCQGCHTFDSRDKRALFDTARARAASAVSELLLAGPPDRVEQEYLPVLSGLIRRTERSGRRDRFERYGGGRGGR